MLDKLEPLQPPYSHYHFRTRGQDLEATDDKMRVQIGKRKSPATPPYSKISKRCTVEFESSINSNTETECVRSSPFPAISFANSTEVWDLMCEMDIKYKKEADIFKNHPVLSAQMRAILLDWIMDVCEAYNLHRETLHLAMDYLDRYLTVHRNILKRHLQLIGISCLFIAAKVEEIYPPKLSVFAYVTDGACTESEILDMELVIMKTLKWKLTPITAASWLNVYLQILGISPYSTRSFDFLKNVRLQRDARPEDARLVQPNYSGVDYVRAIRIIDLTTLDIQSLRFSYSTIAAAAIYHMKGRAAALGVSGFSWEHLGPCVYWMAPFAQVVRKEDVPDVLPGITGVPDESRHLIQAHCISLQMLEQVQLVTSTSKICSPLTHTEGLLTPPRSSEKRESHYNK